MHEFEIDPFNAPWWLRRPNLQTMWAGLLRPTPDPGYRRERLETPDQDFIDLDLIDGDPTSPLVLAVHGFEGSARSPYVRRLMCMVRDRGWNGVALNLRGCSGEDNNLLGSYHSGHTVDLAWIVTRLAAEHPGRPIHVAGYSLGGNILGCWIGQHADQVPSEVVSTFICCAPFDLSASADAIERGLSRGYLWNFLRSIRRKAERKAARFPGVIDLDRALRARNLRKFDNAVTAPTFGFIDSADYYLKASAMPHLANIRVPSLVLCSLDDPLVPPACIPGPDALRDSAVRVAIVERGGHLAFVSGDHESWLEAQAMRWFDHARPSSTPLASLLHAKGNS